MSECTHVEGHQHNCAYVDWRESLIPVAVAHADEIHPQPEETIGMACPLNSPVYVAWTRRWDAAFHRAMLRLTADPFIVNAMSSVNSEAN